VSRPISLGLAQISGEPYQVERNRRLCREAITSSFEQGADLVLLPELIIPGYVADPDLLPEVAEEVPGPTTEEWAGLAAAAGGYVVGGLAERKGNLLYNSAVMVGPEGLIGHYRKAHPFGAEKLAFTPGDLGFPVVETRLGSIGLCVCYDLRFVEVTRILSLKGAELICVPTAWLPGFDQRRWDHEGMCPQARTAEVLANLNQVFIACASQAGPHGDYDFLGSSVVIDPYGATFTGPLPGSEDQVVVTALDLDQAHQALVRSNLISPRADRRRDLYGIEVGGELL
jgi:predicted amidohydrolase